MRCRVMSRLIAVAAAIACATPAALASDYSNTCKSSDGRYVMEDGVLYAAADKQQQRKLPFAIVERQVLSERAGHCIASGQGANGQKIGFQSINTRIVIEIGGAGAGRRATMTCEMASDGMPAAWTCAREVVERDIKTPGPVERYTVGSPGTWDHNGSVMRLEADGATRRFTYMNPRKGLHEVGVNGDTILFDGRREGNRYVGTARWFSKTCGQQEFPVTGTVSVDERQVELSGQAPRVDGKCRKTGTATEKLVFTLNR